MMKKRLKIKALSHSLKNPRGFTLIEMIAAIVLLGVIGIFSTQFITSITQSAQLTTAQKGLVDDAKLAMEFLVREVRVAISDDTNTIVPTAASITFNKFTPYDVDTNTVNIVYAWNSGTQTLTRNSNGTVTILATQVTGFTVAETQNGDERFYVFTMTLTGPNGENFTLESGVRPRSTTV